MPQHKPIGMYTVNLNANAYVWSQLRNTTQAAILKARTFGGLEVALALRVPKTVAREVFRASAYNENRDHLRFLLAELRGNDMALITLSNKQEVFVAELEKLLA